MTSASILPDDIVPVMHELVHAASLAPSSHNTQPWLFRLREDGIDLLADRTRALPVNDPNDRELTISCGCALFNLRVAAAAAGLRADVVLLPDAAEPDLLARVALATTAAPGAEAALHAAVGKRRTFRKRFSSTPVDVDVIRWLVEAAQREGATLIMLHAPEARASAAQLVAEGDALQWADPRWRRELAAWMHPRRRGDGLLVPGLVAPMVQAVVRSFDMGDGVAATDRELADESPLLAVLVTVADTPRDWLMAGQALQRLLLVGVAHGLQASYLNQPVQVEALRPRLQNLTGQTGHPQVLLRLGSAAAAPRATPRRPVADVLIDE